MALQNKLKINHSFGKIVGKDKKMQHLFTEIQMLMQHDFPGNVRELENAIERAVLYETTDRLQPQSLLLHQTQEGSQVTTSSTTDATTILPLDEVERRAIVHALKGTDNNISEAA